MAYGEPLKDPSNPDVPDYDPETPDLSGLIEQALRAHDIRLRVALPAVVTQVLGVQQVDVQPTLQARYLTGEAPVSLPPIRNVPVLMPSGQGYHLKLPIKTGDMGLLLFCDRSLDTWSQSSGKLPVDPADSRTHDLSDAVFLPGMVPFGSQLQDSSDDLEIACGDMSVRIQPGGTLKLGSTASGGQELMSLLGQVLDNQIAVIDQLAGKALTNTLMGPQPFLANTVAVFAQLKSTAQDLAKKLGGLTGR